MKPTLEALLALFRRHPDVWLNHAVVYEAGGHRTTARIMELRRMGFQVGQRGQGEQSQYRFEGRTDPGYESFSCACGWAGTEPQALRTFAGFCCPVCSRPVVPQKAATQTVLSILGVP